MANLHHPYYPIGTIINNFQVNDMGALEILGYFFGGLVLAMLLIAGTLFNSYKASNMRKLVLCWLLLSGCIHTILEGHFAIFNSDVATRMDFLSQVWKEYAKGDSRYMIQDTFTVCMEIITALVDGPLCFLTIWSFVNQHSSRYILQLVVSLAQLYGCVLYFLTEWFEGFKHGPVNHLVYFWFYFVFMNVLWIVIPFILIVDSAMNLMDAQLLADGHTNKKRT